ncbi:hypothetical protein [Nonomuraea sediminis]|uniref:hypothetical protein n=1 Tax=Nonomuraea sediminis TaxID=2835864 RepID=UPI001BDDBFC7|nr:hypothetical protein [Nonomuraea sediminis]
MRKVIKGLVVVGGLATLLAMPVEASASTAAGPVNFSCGPKINSGITNNETQVGYAETGGGFVNVWKSKDRPYRGRNIYFATGRLHRGEKISLDWSDDGGRSYHACHASGSHATTYAIDQTGNRAFRGCVYSNKRWKCTDWKIYN